MVIAGGTDLLRAHDIWPPACGVLDVSRIPELRGIHHDPDGWSIGAAVTWREVAASTLPAALIEAALALGSPQVRATGTVGGNVVSSWAAGDGLAALVCLRASAVIASAGGERTVPLSGRIALAPGELLVRLRVPATAGRSGYLRHSLRPGFGPLLMSACAVLDDSPRMVLNSGTGLLTVLDGGRAGADGVDLGAAYETAMARTLLRRLLQRLQA